MPPGKTSPFTVEERKWIILKFGELKSPILVRRAFRKQFPKVSPRDIPDVRQFFRVLEKFNACGDIGDSKPKNDTKESVPQPDIDAVQVIVAPNSFHIFWFHIFIFYHTFSK